MTDYRFIESIKNLSIEEQKVKLQEYIEQIHNEYNTQILLLQSQVSKYSDLYYECQDQLYKH